MRKFLPAVGVATAVVAASAGILAGAGAGPVPADVPAPGRRIVLPLDAFGLSVQESRTVDLAVNLLLAGCMRAGGHPMDVVDRVGEPLTADRRYGISDEAEALRYGYALPPATAAQKREERLNGRAMGRDEAATFARCGAEPAIRELALAPPLAQRLGRESYDAVLGSPVGRTALTDWKACLATHGVSRVDDVWFPAGALPVDTATSRDVALLDVRCKRSTRLVESLTAAEATIQTALVRRHADELTADRRHIAEVVRHAETVVTARRAATTSGQRR
ncbi:hypothetical protein [Actinoplanes sp. NPDC051494]|uniref:hypothetical protein n=1 Tax=Actinoplanes sp. NPDC051494 TaxID=3363907 RepID=UPI0037AC8B78